MRRVLIVLAFQLIVLCSAQLTKANWLDESIVASAVPSSATLHHGAWVWGGSNSIKIPTTSVKPFHVALPKITASGCGGINAFWGGFSMLDPDMLVQFGQNVLAAAPSYAFELALQNLCEPCQAIMGHLNKMAGDLNNMTLDSCNAAKGGVKLISSYMGTESVKGEIDSSAKKYLGKMEETIGEYSDDVHKIFNKQIADFEANPLEKRLVVPDDANHYLSFWVSIVAHKMSNATFINFNAGHEAISTFFTDPKEFIEFIRAITGDLLFARGVKGIIGTEDKGAMSGWTASEKYQIKVVPDKFIKLYQDVTIPITNTVDCNNDLTPMHPIVSVAIKNKLWGLKLPDEPGAAYTASSGVGQGYVGFAFARVGGQVSIPDQEISCFTLNPPEAGGCGVPIECGKNRINNILDNIRATTAAGVRTDLSNFTSFNALPVYLLTNRVGMISMKFPGIMNEVRESLATVATYSYVTARLNEALSVAERLLIEGKTAALSLKKKEFEDYKVLEDWVGTALRNIEKAKLENTNFMMETVHYAMNNIGSKIKYYTDIENGITKTVSASSFNAIYASDWR